MRETIEKYIEKIRNDLYTPCKILVHLERMKNELLKMYELDEDDYYCKLKPNIKDSLGEIENDY